jgi:hypothetical protein
MRELIGAEKPGPSQQLETEEERHDEGSPILVCADLLHAPIHLTVCLAPSCRMADLLAPAPAHAEHQTSRILRAFLPRCFISVKAGSVRRPTVLKSVLCSAQEDNHFRISDSLGTLPATLTSPLTTKAGVMKTPY